jgi:hypothetical protein
VDGFLFFGSRGGEALWRLRDGSVELRRHESGEVLSANAKLTRAYPGGTSSSDPVGTVVSDEMSLSGLPCRPDIGTAINIFEGISHRGLPELKRWLEEDSELSSLLPATPKEDDGGDAGGDAPP